MAYRHWPSPILAHCRTESPHVARQPEGFTVVNILRLTGHAVCRRRRSDADGATTRRVWAACRPLLWMECAAPALVHARVDFAGALGIQAGLLRSHSAMSTPLADQLRECAGGIGRDDRCRDFGFDQRGAGRLELGCRRLHSAYFLACI